MLSHQLTGVHHGKRTEPSTCSLLTKQACIPRTDVMLVGKKLCGVLAAVLPRVSNDPRRETIAKKSAPPSKLLSVLCLNVNRIKRVMDQFNSAFTSSFNDIDVLIDSPMRTDDPAAKIKGTMIFVKVTRITRTGTLLYAKNHSF